MSRSDAGFREEESVQRASARLNSEQENLYSNRYAVQLESKQKKLYSEQVGREIEQKGLDTVDRQAGKAAQSTVSYSMRGLEASRRAA